MKAFCRKEYLFPLGLGFLLSVSLLPRRSEARFLSDACFLIGLLYLLEAAALTVWRLGFFDRTFRGTKKMLGIWLGRPEAWAEDQDEREKEGGIDRKSGLEHECELKNEDFRARILGMSAVAFCASLAFGLL
jgi:hypothetical protein